MTARIAALALALPLCLFAETASANCGGGPWTGFYIGGQIGVGVADTKITSPDDPRISGDDASFTIGGHSGYNLQCGQIVLGFESETNYLGLETTGRWDSIFGDVNLKDSIDWFGTLRGRLGALVSPDTMLYVTGGLAYAHVEHKLSIPGANFSQKDSDWEFGWTIGGGVEFLRHGNWMFRAEALYVDLGSSTHRYDLSTACGIVCEGTAKWDDSFWVGRLGVSYKLGGPEPRYQPLK